MTVVTLSQSESGESLEARHNDTSKGILMITVTRCSWAAGVVLLVTSLSAAGESPGVAINPDRTTALLPRDELPGHDPVPARDAPAL